ncbi:MAG: hypothetical protein JJU13_12850 [Balneolaceae bacterium]|nr:hypothetical protein [Balneolaceae bacterium]
MFQKLITLIKKIVRRPVWAVMNLYDSLPFSAKSRAVKKFDKLAEEKKLFFSTSIFINGFTDQLCGLIFFYTLGTRMGMKYLFSPLNSRRSHFETVSENTAAEFPAAHKTHKNDPDEYSDIYDFIGVNNHLKSLSKNSTGIEFNKILFDLDQIKFDNRILQSFDHFINDLKFRIIRQTDISKQNLFYFRALPTMFKNFRLIVSHETGDLPFRTIYERNRKEKGWSSAYHDSAINLMVHIRQGDTAVIKTPWNTYIPVWYKIEGRLHEYESKEDIDSFEIIDVDEFYKFLKKLLNQFNTDRFSSVVFSDGFKSAFDLINSDKEKEVGEDGRQKKMQELKQTYDNQEFKKFLEWTEVKTVLGEEKEKLFDLIDSFIKSDVVIIGTQQKMIPKLLKIYCNPENMPFLITLYKKKEPHVNYLGIGPEFKHRMNVDLDDYDIAEISERLENFLNERKPKLMSPAFRR